MHKKISPEEKLLSIIKGKTTADNAGQAIPAGKGSPANTPPAKNKIDDYLSALLKNNFFKNNLFDPQVLNIFNRYMVVIVALLALYLVLDIFFINPSRKADLVISGISASAGQTSPVERSMPVDTKNYSYYSNRITGKSIFKGGAASEAESQAQAEAPDGNVGLVGIIPGDKPQAIVEDKKGQTTYYLIKGQTINDITVDDISTDKVILEYKGKKMTLFL